MIVVTGGAGFIGSALVHSLLADDTPVTVVDDVRADRPGQNLHGIELAAHLGQDEFLAAISRDPAATLDGVDAVLHQGACSDTMATDAGDRSSGGSKSGITVGRSGSRP